MFERLTHEPKITDIIKVSAFYFGCDMVQLTGQRRTRPLVKYRQMAIYVCRFMTSRSYHLIAEQFSDRDHTTIMHAICTIERERKLYPDVDEALSQIMGTLGMIAFMDSFCSQLRIVTARSIYAWMEPEHEPASDSICITN